MPEEINDADWHDLKSKALLVNHLHLLADGLNALTPGKPVGVSSFAVGAMTASEYAAFWNDILTIDSLVLWHQDGGGTGALPVNERNAYIQALFNTLAPGRWGVIVELFRQQPSTDGSFIATPVEINELQSQISRRQGVSTSLTLAGFSLRYLFDSNSQLLNDYAAAYCP